jgi:uncharacterized membrane protein YjdF
VLFGGKELERQVELEEYLLEQRYQALYPTVGRFQLLGVQVMIREALLRSELRGKPLAQLLVLFVAYGTKGDVEGTPDPEELPLVVRRLPVFF